MVTIRREATLPAPPAQVWETAIPPAGWEQWLSLHKRWPDGPPTTLAAGSEFVQVASLLNIPMPVRWQVTDCAAPTLLAMTGQALAGVSLFIRFDLADDPAHGAGQTALTMTADLSGALIVGSLQSTVQKFADAELTASLEALTRLLAGDKTA